MRRRTVRQRPQDAAQVTELPPVVVLATRINTPAEALGRSFDLLEGPELEELKYPDLTAVLMDQPSVSFKGYGPYDSNGQARIRGLSTYHTKLLIDGMPFMDASSTQVFPMLSALSPERIKRIEVLKGVSSLQHSGLAQALLEEQFWLSATYFESRVHDYIISIYNSDTYLYIPTRPAG